MKAIYKEGDRVHSLASGRFGVVCARKDQPIRNEWVVWYLPDTDRHPMFARQHKFLPYK